jgi:hypothetical protein
LRRSVQHALDHLIGAPRGLFLAVLIIGTFRFRSPSLVAYILWLRSHEYRDHLRALLSLALQEAVVLCYLDDPALAGFVGAMSTECSASANPVLYIKPDIRDMIPHDPSPYA